MNFDQLLVWLVPALILALGGYWKYEQRKTRADTEKLRDELSAHKLQVAKEYATKAELGQVKDEMTQEMRRGFTRLEAKFDNRESGINELLNRILASLSK